MNSLKWKVALFLILGCCLISFTTTEDSTKWNNKTTVSELLSAFGESLPPHAKPDATAAQIKQGRELVYLGRTIGPDGKKSKYISKFYTCVSCHSPEKTNPNLKSFNPQDRLEYAAANNLKFLQGSTFYGIANRESWYNDDYVLKYGDLVKPASESLAESTQLCAKVCSSGRYLEEWELEAIMAYYWNNQIKLEDLDFTKEELEALNSTDESSNSEMVAMIKSKYALKSPATFGHMPENQEEGYITALKGNPENGKKIYELSCMACHQEGGVSGTTFENSKLDFQKFKRNIGVKADYNLYQIVRKGTYAEHGKLRYMPLYPKERMSDQQLEDLRAYIEQEAQ